MAEERTRRIRERAHSIWEQEGRLHGLDAQHWSQAEREIDAEDAARTSSPTETSVARRQPKRRAGAKTVVDTTGATQGEATAEVAVDESVKTRGRKSKDVREDGAEAPKAARGRKAKAVAEEGSISSTAAGDADSEAVAEETKSTNAEAAQDAELPEEPKMAAEASHTAE